MNTKNYCYQSVVMLFLLLMTSAQADSKIKFSMTPITSTHVQLTGNEKTLIKYEVKNNTKLTRSMTMSSVTGLYWLENDPNICSNPFTLAPGASCVLNLQPDGRNIDSTSIKICKVNGDNDNTPSNYLCSKTSVTDDVRVTNTYNLNPLLLIGEISSEDILVCEINESLNVLENCVRNPQANTPHDIALNYTFTKAYLNIDFGNQMRVCDFSAKDKVLTNCQDIAPGGSYVHGTKVLPNGKYIYIPFYFSDAVYVCELNSTTGMPFNCIATGSGLDGPSAIAFDGLSTKAYISNFNSREISLCDIDSATGLLSNCHITTSLASVSVKIQDMIISPDSSRVYLTIETPDIYTCDIDKKTSELVHCRIAGSVGKQNLKIRINNSYTKAYISVYQNDNVIACDVTASNGAITHCKNLINLSRPYGLDIAG